MQRLKVFIAAIAAFTLAGCTQQVVVGFNPTRPDVKPGPEVAASCRIMARGAQDSANVGYMAQTWSPPPPGVPAGSFADSFIRAGQAGRAAATEDRTFLDCMIMNGYMPVYEEQSAL